MAGEQDLVVETVRDILGGFERGAASEDGEAAEDDLLVRSEELVGPGDGVAQRLVALG